MDIISVVLGADTKKDRTRDSIKIIEYTFANYKMVDIAYILHSEFDEIVQNSKIFVEKGISDKVMLKLSENNIGLYPVKKEYIKDVNIESKIVENLSAPVNKEDKIGNITIKIGEDVIYDVEILVNNNIPKRGILDYIWIFCKLVKNQQLIVNST